MNGTVEDYLRRVESSLQTDRDTKRSIMDELRSHIADKVADMQRRSPERPRDAIVGDVLHGLGEPSEFALRFEGERPVLQRRGTGETVLRVTRAVGRGTKRVIRGLLFTILVLMLLVAGVAAWAFQEVRPYVEGRLPLTLYEFERSCPLGSPCVENVTGSFHVQAGAARVQFSLSVHPPSGGGNGTLHLRVTDPGGLVKFDRVLSAAGRGHVHESLAWAPLEGDWTVELRLVAFVGYADVEARTSGFPD